MRHVHRTVVTFSAALLALACDAPKAAPQEPAPAAVPPPPAPPPPPPPSVDTARMPFAGRPAPVRADALLPGTRIIAYYGNPLSTRMGILGEIPPPQMMAKLEATAKQWARADTTVKTQPALHLIATVAMGTPGDDRKYRLRHGDSLIARVASWAEPRNWLMFLDVQVGRSSVRDEIQRLTPWLRKPWVHLAIDPEFAMPEGSVPGKRIGTVDASDVNYAIDMLARIVEENHLPPKVLVVHRFTVRMLTRVENIRTDPRVQVVIDMDGFGPPQLKLNIFNLVITQRPVQYAGLKLFYKNDKPMLTLAQVLALKPVPLYIQYQ
jgi:hypothetical protein